MSRIKTLLAFAVLWPVVTMRVAAQDVELKVEANRTRLYIGESFILQVKVSGISRAPEPDLSAVTNCTIKPLGSQDISNYSIVIVNGRMVKEGFTGRQWSYAVSPLTAGEFRVGPVSLTIDGKILSKEGPVVRVTDIEKQDLVMMSVVSSRESALIDEPFEILLAITMKRLKGAYADVDPFLSDAPPSLNVPFLEGDEIPGLACPDVRQLLQQAIVKQSNKGGFSINNYSIARDPFDINSMMDFHGFFEDDRKARFIFPREEIALDGQSYYKYRLALTYTPKEEGNYVFGPVVFKGPVPIEVDQRGRATTRDVFAVGSACTVRVLPPPDEDRPSSFIGAVGSNMTVQASVDAQTCNVGDPLKLTLTLSGNIRLDKLMPPKLSLQTNIIGNFTVYDDSVQTVKKENVRQYLYTLRPLKAGQQTIPPVEVSYFDVKNRAYKTLRTAPLAVTVRRSEEVTASQIVGNATNRIVEQQTKRQVPSNMAPIRILPDGAVPQSLYVGTWQWWVIIAGPVLYVLILIGGGARRWVAGRRLSYPRRHAFSRVMVCLDRVRARAGADPATAEAELRVAVRHYIIDRFEGATAGMTPPEVCSLLMHSGIPESLAGRFAAIMEPLFNAGFAGNQARGEVGPLCDEVTRLVQAIETHQSTQERNRRNNRSENG